jgi:hypothetical protein
MHLVFGHQTGRVLQKLDNLLWERRLRITTRATYKARGDTQSVPAERHYYGTVSYRAIFKILSFFIAEAFRCIRGSRLRQRPCSLLRRNLRHSRSDWNRIPKYLLRPGTPQCAPDARKADSGIDSVLQG